MIFQRWFFFFFFAKECIIGALWMDKRHLSGCLFVPLVDFLLPFGLASSCRWSVTSNPLFHTVSFHEIIFECFDLSEGNIKLCKKTVYHQHTVASMHDELLLLRRGHVSYFSCHSHSLSHSAFAMFIL